MIKEKFKKARDAIRFALTSRYKDTYPGYKIKGEIFWKLENTSTGEIQEGHKNNIVTLDASILVARLMKGTAVPYTSEPRFGIFALAVGTGSVAWDPLNPPPPTTTQRSLENEIARKQVSTASFIDPSGNIVGYPTNVVDLTVIFSESEAVGTLVEMALLGGDVNSNMAVLNPVLPPNGVYDATFNVVGYDMLGTYLTFGAITKPPTSTLSLVYRLSF
jgi:hypothetical protein